MILKSGTLRLGEHAITVPTGAAITLIHVFQGAPQRPRRCAICGKAMADHPVFEYKAIKQSK